MIQTTLILTTDLVITIFVEMIVSLIMGVRSVTDQLLILGMNGITNPILHLLMSLAAMSSLGTAHLYVLLACLEVLVVLTESAFLKHNVDTSISPLRLSCAINAASFAVGLAADAIISGRIG